MSPLFKPVGQESLTFDIYFTLSGFFIVKMLFKECDINNGKIDYKFFIIQRFLRIWPALLIVCVFMCVKYSLSASFLGTFEIWFSPLIFVNNIWGNEV
jgi:peptidoglycan/LPS O-acetylase OafA/YrhL